MSSLREVHLGMRESMEDEGGSSAAVLGSCLGASVLSFVRECETHWRMGVVAIVVTLIAYHKLCPDKHSNSKEKKQDYKSHVKTNCKKTKRKYM